MIRDGESEIKGLDASKVDQLKQLAKICAKSTCSSLATMLDIPLGMVGTECIYPPMYRMVGKKARLPPGSLIILASDVRAEGRSRIVLTLTKADATELVDRGKKVMGKPSRALVDEDKTFLMSMAGTLIDNYLAPMTPYLGASFSTTPPVVSFDVIRGHIVPSKMKQLFNGYNLMMETHFIDRSGRIRGSAIFLPDGMLTSRMIERIGA